MEVTMENQRDLLSRVSEEWGKIPDHSPFLSYNVFQVLGIQEKEVVMCRFLADLLDPQGAHGCGIQLSQKNMSLIMIAGSIL